MATSFSEAARNALLQTDKIMLGIVLAHVPVLSLLVPLGHDTFGFAALSSFVVAAVALLAYAVFRGTLVCAAVFGACLMLFSAIMIQSRLGMIEMHFHIFVALAFLVIYRSWVPVTTGAVVIAVHHFLFNGLQMNGAQLGDMPIIIFNHGASWGTAVVHAAFVVVESAVLIFLCLKMWQQRKQALQIVGVVEAFEQSKDLTNRLDSSLGTNSAASFNNMMAQFSNLIETLRGLSGALRGNADSLTGVSQHTSEIAAEQHEETVRVADAMNEMLQTVEEVARNAQVASDASNQAAAASSKGEKSMAQAQMLTDATDAAMADSARMVSELVERVQSIDSVIASINGISEQTNLLALNAAIEAARAGEHGRGFSVVADEVRNLSRRTQEFTDEIRRTIGDLAEGSEATLAAIEMSQTRAKETTAAIRSSGKEIGLIQEQIAEVDSMNRQIASASEQQAATSHQINDSVQKVSNQNRDVVDEAEKTRAMAEELERIVQEMSGLIREYRVS